MRIALLIILAIHAIIHLFGFLKAFELAQFEALKEPVSRSFGILWLLAGITLICSLILNISGSNAWWLLGLMGVFLSQILIFYFWSDAKFGSIANLIILIAVVLAYFQFSFDRQMEKEIAQIKANTQELDSERISKEDISHLPAIVQKWLDASGVLGREPISRVYLEQALQFRMKPEDQDWSAGTAQQYFSVEPPAFHWTTEMKMNSILKVLGRDRYVNGEGEMTIKLLGMLAVADVKADPKTNQATLQRYLAEIVWFPTAALSPYLEWEQIDELSAKASMRYQGVEGSGTFHFNEAGEFTKFSTLRYMDANDEAPTEWVVKAKRLDKFNGIQIPVECEASWILESGEWNWLKLEIEKLSFEF
jgi:hypothetical protein